MHKQVRHGAAALGLALAAALAVTPVSAQSIYPLTRAEILAGSKFDLKVEVPGEVAAGDLKVTINGRDATVVLAKAAAVTANEDGLGHTAYWIKDVSLGAPGKYEVKAVAGEKTKTVTWEVFGTPRRRARNVILFIGDGMSVAHRTAARILSKGLVEGRYGGELAIDDMPHMALVSTSGTDAVVTDSANSMHAYTTGHKSCNNALGVYCARNKSVLDHPKVETISELVKRRHKMAVGIVTNTEIEDATPAGMIAHDRDRRDYDNIVRMMFDARPDVVMGGGRANFLPKSAEGSKRKDEEDYLKKFQEAGYTYAATNTEMMAAAANPATKHLLGLFNMGNLDGALDRRVLKKGTVPRYPDQPDLADQTKVAIDILAKKPNGFMLMVESGMIDKYTHLMDWERAAYDVILLDNAVKVAKTFAAKRNDTLIIIVPDHAHPISVIGSINDDRPGTGLRAKLGVYNDSVFPNYPPADADGYPPSIDVSRRLALGYGAYPDHCTAGKPSLEGPYMPTQPGDTKPGEDKTNVANEKFCAPAAERRIGNLPLGQAVGVHSADDVILTAMGPGAEQLRGRIDNTRVFRTIANALGLGSGIATSAVPSRPK
jgi:alkaline phosphatase